MSPMTREVPTNLYKSISPLIGSVLENRRLTSTDRPPENDVRHIVLSSDGLSYLPGQSVGVVPDGYDARTGKHQKLRLYSVSSESNGDHKDGKTVSVVVVRHFWREPEIPEVPLAGVCSRYLCDCDVGEKVRITGPVGKRFLLPLDFRSRDLIFIATGTGIAPYRGMIKEMFGRNYHGKAYLFFGVRYADTLLYDDEFRSYVDRPNFRYITALSREAEQNPFPNEIPTVANKMYVQVRLWQHRVEIGESLAKPDTLVFICGLKGIEKAILYVIDRIGELQGETGLSQRLKAEQRILLEVY